MPAGSKKSGTLRKVFKKTPGLIEAEAYDAASIIISNINKGATTRRSMQRKLEGTYDFEGSTGRISFDDTGESIRELFFLSVQGCLWLITHAREFSFLGEAINCTVSQTRRFSSVQDIITIFSYINII